MCEKMYKQKRKDKQSEEDKLTNAKSLGLDTKTFLPSKNLEKCYANATPTGLLVPFPARKIVA